MLRITLHSYLVYFIFIVPKVIFFYNKYGYYAGWIVLRNNICSKLPENKKEKVKARKDE